MGTRTASALAGRWEDVVCPGCLLPRTVTARHARRIRDGAYPLECSSCRRPRKQLPVSDDDRSFWLERFSLAEIREMAGAIWGPATLTASFRAERRE